MNGRESSREKCQHVLETASGKTKSNSIEVPSISLPKGGGALRGIDEKFLVNASNGSASFSIPLPFSNSRGFAPQISVSYSSSAGNGIFGLGWKLDLTSIKRKTEKGLPRYFDSIDSDTFLISEAEDLVSEFKKNADGSFFTTPEGNYLTYEKDSDDGLNIIRYYRPRVEGLFARIERWYEKNTRIIKWRVISKDNVTTLYGWNQDSRLYDPNNESNIFEWFPEFSFDDKGNCSHYLYQREDDIGLNDSLAHNQNRLLAGNITYTNLYLSKILYGNKSPYKAFGDSFPLETNYLFQTKFDYGTLGDTDSPETINAWDFRKDAFSNYKSGFEIRTTRLCKRVLLIHFFDELPNGSAVIKSANFSYDTNIEGFTFLKAITGYGYIKKPDGSYSLKTVPPTEFEYQAHDWNNKVSPLSEDALIHAPNGLDEKSYQFVDLFNEGLSGILTENTRAWYYKHNLGNGDFAQAKLISPKPSFSGLGSQLQLSDLDADGTKQLISLHSEPKGYFELNDDNEWQNFKAFQQMPNIDLNQSNIRMIDLNGDGKPEILITEDNIFTWYESDGRKGFSTAHKIPKPFDEEAGPHLVFADQTQSIFLADMSGDGLTDIVRIKNSSVSYWPNLGYGKFGAKISMDNAPVFDDANSFNPAFIKLADIDGSGTTDIIYLAKNKFSCWMNLSGNSFTENPFEITAFPEIHNLTKISVLDLLGTGLSCITWSSPLNKNSNNSLLYIDLMNSKKPHLMVSYKNNLGKEVSVEYTPSTKFYLEDKLSGKPWITKLHFPVHCISKTETRDLINGSRFSSTYKYHHGYYDHAEAEFRGFGMVEQTDTESFEHWSKSSFTVIDEELYQEPIITKHWFHTGAFLRADEIQNQFENEHWYAEMSRAGFAVTNHEKSLDSIRVISAPDLSSSLISKFIPQEWQEAVRACKSLSLRKEIFAHDAAEIGATEEEVKKQLTPFSVSANNAVVELLQPKGHNKHAVFIVKESESINYSYERNTEDPRISHTLNIQIDEYGNILESASVVYPRLVSDSSLDSDTQNAQNKTIITYAEKNFTNDIITDDHYRLRMSSEVKTYELKGVNKTDFYYNISDFINILNTATEVAYHQIDSEPIPGNSQKRLTEHIKTLYRKNNLKDVLALHKLESLGLPYENYQLAYTPELLSDIYSLKANPATLTSFMNLGKFTHSLDAMGNLDSNWWVRSGTSEYIENSETANAAQNRFYAPLAYIDPYGAKSTVKYYQDYYLFVKEVTDALGNKNTVELFNFRTLAPQRTRDVNNNISESLSDELGLLKATAIFGKGSEADDLSGHLEYSSLAEEALITSYLNTGDSSTLTNLAKSLLKHATSYFVHDLYAFKNTGKPALISSISREEHYQKNNNSPVQIAFDYSDGHGKVVLKKTQAEPGLAKQATVNPDNSYSILEVNTGASLPKKLRWLGNGKTVVNNKGKAVKQYEPFFSTTHKFENLKELVETGVSPINYYDALGRLVKTVMPNKTLSRTEFNSWKQIKYDFNDCILESDWYTDRTNRLIDAELIAAGKDPSREKIAADKAAKHANTPSIEHLDSLGRSVLQITHNKNPVTEADEFYLTKANRDIEGNLRSATDARNNTVINYKYDMLGRNVYHNSMDAGQHWRMANIMGNPLRTWDERNHTFEYSYDILHRPIEAKILGGDGINPLNHVYERIFYGESEINPEVKNLRGKVIKYYDTAGLQESLEFDFKGSPKSSTRKLFKKYKDVTNWLDANLVSDLEAEAYTFITETDALDRMTRQTTPNSDIITASYNEGGLLNSESIYHPELGINTTYIQDVDYNERGVHSKIVYGNGISTDFYYDRETYRLNRLRSRRENEDPLQDYYYTYDPVGNIINIEDKNIPTVFFNNEKITGLSTYTYDATYRLIESSGRENNKPLNFGANDNWSDSDYRINVNYGDSLAMRNYTQQYQYDSVGNITQMRHQAASNNWTRDYSYAATNNRLNSTLVGQGINSFTYNYTHHSAHGYMTALPNLDDVVWNFKEEVVKTIRQRRFDGGTPETTYYQYDKSGQRIRKITENQADIGLTPSKKEERIYIAGYELYKKHSGSDAGLERHSLSLLDKGKRFALIETRNDIDDDTEKHLVRYQLHNHIGSSNLELDANAAVISYEEYHPFGTTAFQAKNASIKSAAKRYRFTDMERDEETGLSYHSSRYYLPWLGRWLSADPIGIGDGVNLYAYSGNRPIGSKDPSGQWEWPSAETVTIVTAVVVVAVVVTVATAGVGTAAVGAAVGAAGLTGGAATAATAVGTVAVAAGSGALGSMAATTTAVGLTERRLPTGSELGDSAASGAVTGVVTLGVGTALSAGARGTVTAARAATVAGTATRATRAVAAVGTLAESSGVGGTAVRTAARVTSGVTTGAFGGATYETTRQVVSGEASANGLDTGRIGTATLGGAAGGGVLNATLGPALSGVGNRSFEFGYTRGISIRALPVRGAGLSWLSSQTGNRYIIGEHGTVSGRRIVTVATPEGPRAFYARTGGGGTNSGGAQPGDWAPFDGFANIDGRLPVTKGWFVKDRYTEGMSESNPLYRFGTPENLATSEWLATQPLRTCPVRPTAAVQGDLVSAGVPVRDPHLQTGK
jgi:RHS repeat-associated protein